MLRVSDIMTADVFTLDPSHTLRTALELLADRSIHGAPVIAGDTVAGVLSLTDILAFEASEPGVPRHRPDNPDWGELDVPIAEEADPNDDAAFFVEMWSDSESDVMDRMEEVGPEWDLLETHTVAEVMTRRVFALTPSASVADAARYMVDGAVHRVLVMDSGALVGLVSAWDIVRAVADRRL